MSIPVSHRLSKDSVIWGWTNNGRFTIKSAYGVAQKWLKECSKRSELGSCSNNSKMKVIWKVVWQLQCPSKIRHFLWNACKNILPTKNRLMGRGVGQKDSCTMCGCSETTGHILWGCSYAKKVWCETKIKLPLVPDSSQEFVDVIWEIREFRSTID